MASEPNLAGIAFQGSLFSSDFLQDSIRGLPDWTAIDDAEVEALRSDLAAIYSAFPTAQSPNESQTEDDVIWPALVRLGWTATLRQQNLTARGRDDVPDGILFPDDEAKARANSFPMIADPNHKSFRIYDRPTIAIFERHILSIRRHPQILCCGTAVVGFSLMHAPA